MINIEDGRIYWQCRRGMRELDILLLEFFNRHFSTLDKQQKINFAELLENADEVLISWFYGRSSPVEKKMQILVKLIRGIA